MAKNMTKISAVAGLALAATLLLASVSFASVRGTNGGGGSTHSDPSPSSTSPPGGSPSHQAAIPPCSTDRPCEPRKRHPAVPVAATDPSSADCKGELRWYYDNSGTLLRKKCERRYETDFDSFFGW